MTPILGGAVPATPLSNGNFILYAGQTHNAGSGTVEWDGDSLNFSIDPNCGIGCIRVGFWNDDSSLPSNPAPGTDLTLGEYNCPEHPTPQTWITDPFDFEIPFSLPDGVEWPIVIGLHADTLGCVSVYQEDTAWACAYDTEPGTNCPAFPGANWAYYFWYDYDSDPD